MAQSSGCLLEHEHVRPRAAASLRPLQRFCRLCAEAACNARRVRERWRRERKTQRNTCQERKCPDLQRERKEPRF
eukprot:4633-Prymnesium_polylepis.1